MFGSTDVRPLELSEGAPGIGDLGTSEIADPVTGWDAEGCGDACAGTGWAVWTCVGGT